MKITSWTLLALLVGCDTTGADCTDMDVWDSLTLAFQPVITTPGTWAFVLTEGIAASCEITLPDPASADDRYVDCEGVDEQRVDRVDGIESLRIYEAPASARLLITYEGTAWFEDVIEPEYAVDEPNGEGCGERFTATMPIEVPEP